MAAKAISESGVRTKFFEGISQCFDVLRRFLVGTAPRELDTPWENR